MISRYFQYETVFGGFRHHYSQTIRGIPPLQLVAALLDYGMSRLATIGVSTAVQMSASGEFNLAEKSDA